VSALFPKLEGLDDLARRDGVDTRPTLVRVLTDLYVQKPTHSSEEERHYTELVLRLLDTVDLATRISVAKKIAGYPGAPPAVARRLARDVIEVAEPVLRHSTVLNFTDFHAIVRDFGPAHAAIIAGRNAPTRAPASAPTTASPVVADATESEQSTQEGSEFELAGLFFSADPAARRQCRRRCAGDRAGLAARTAERNDPRAGNGRALAQPRQVHQPAGTGAASAAREGRAYR
jgi:uncharacterized protein (DUF2336 family)